MAKTIRQLYNDEELSEDAVCLNEVPFLTNISERINYVTVGAVDNLKCVTLENELRSIIRAYSVRGFRTEVVQVDIQFKALKDRSIFSVVINAMSRDEHAKKIERYDRVIKKRSTFFHAILPFDSLSRVMVMHLLKTAVLYVDDFVWKKGVSQTLSPLSIVKDAVLDFRLYFLVMHGKFLKTTRAQMTP